MKEQENSKLFLKEKQRKAEYLFQKSLKLDDLGKSINSLKKAIELDPEELKYYAQRSIFFSKIGMYKNSLNDYKIAAQNGLPSENNSFRRRLLFAKAFLEIEQHKYIDALSSLSALIDNLLVVVPDSSQKQRKKLFSPFGKHDYGCLSSKEDLFLAYSLRATTYKKLLHFDKALTDLDVLENLALNKKQKGIVSAKRYEVRRAIENLKAEQERRRKSTLSYRVKNFTRTSIAFFPWIILSPKFLFPPPQDNILGFVGAIAGILIMLMGAMSSGDEATAWTAFGFVILLTSQLIMLVVKCLNSSEREILSFFDEISIKITGLSIHDQKHFLFR